MPVPFLGRLHPAEYLALVASFVLVGLEALIRVLTLALRERKPAAFPRCAVLPGVAAHIQPVHFAGTKASREQEEMSVQQGRCLPLGASRHADADAAISTSVRDASDFVELCQLWGYEAEEHIVQTKDGFLLGIHRLQWRKGEEGQKVNNGPGSLKKRIAYLHHGLLMNSEVWVCLTDEQRCLPFELVERGFDVWFGNNRGNKYSKKSIHCSPTTVKFWDFSMDEFAFHDIPDSIAYILDTTGQKSLSYIGFSQGTAQAFATLAIHPNLNNQVNVFIGLAPAMAPAGLSNGVVDSLVKASPSVLYLMFGRRSILSSATMWETLLYPPLFSRVIDMGLSFLFGWRTRNISTSQKLAAYPHLYSFTSTKTVVHWFQIIRNKCFQMYDDDVHQPMSVTTANKYSKVAKYPTRNIRTPVVLVYGGSDSLVDIKSMLKELPPQTVATEIPHYEHLDFLWAWDVDSQVFQHVFDALDSFTDAEHTAEEYDRYYLVRSESLIGSGYPISNHRGSEGDASAMAGCNGEVQPAAQMHQHRAREQQREGGSPRFSTRPARTAEPERAEASAKEAQPSEKLKGVGVRRGGAARSTALDSISETSGGGAPGADTEARGGETASAGGDGTGKTKAMKQ
ncbi:lipase [Tolypocladium capitatum]|uniref:Lipase n=1 Tax=Tolypocladium capitatum TaxID=45235 RepID=A0A2K3QNH9_9HYPO|nr:lipase [Tolypocladium capitatum]